MNETQTEKLQSTKSLCEVAPPETENGLRKKNSLFGTCTKSFVCFPDDKTQHNRYFWRLSAAQRMTSTVGPLAFILSSAKALLRDAVKCHFRHPPQHGSQHHEVANMDNGTIDLETKRATTPVDTAF